MLEVALFIASQSTALLPRREKNMSFNYHVTSGTSTLVEPEAYFFADPTFTTSRLNESSSPLKVMEASISHINKLSFLKVSEEANSVVDRLLKAQYQKAKSEPL